jgi:hypothetical protein
MPLRRRRAVLTTAILAAGAAAVLALGWDEIAVAWRAARFEQDPRALARAVFLEPGTIDARAALACLRADELEARFAAEVAGREWRFSVVRPSRSILGPQRVEGLLSFEPSGDGYRADFEFVYDQGRKTTVSERRLVETRGPFLVDLETPGRADTWGVARGKLVLPAFARVGDHAWLSVRSRRAQDITIHSFEFFEFDDAPAAGMAGACRYAGSYDSREPVIDRLRDALAGSLLVVPFRAEPGDDGTIGVRIATDPETVLLIDPRTGTGWHGSGRRWPEGALWKTP